MVVIGLGVVWAGFLLASFGAHLWAGDGVSLLDLAIPGHYVRTHGTSSK